MALIYKWFTPLEDSPTHPVTRDRIMNWMAESGYIEGYIHKKISPMDKEYVEDYIQECWMQILEIPEEKLVEIYRRGKGKFTNYIKALINNNIRSSCSKTYNHIRRAKKNEMYLDDEEWKILESGQRESTADVVWPELIDQPDAYHKYYAVGSEKVNIRTEDELYEEDKDA